MISRIVLAAALSMLACFGRAAEPLKIGMVAPVTGPQAESGRYEIQGAQLAVEEINKAGGVLGRPIELVIEDDQTTNPGVVLAFSKLAGDKDIPAFIGPFLSTQIHAMAPDIQRLGKPVMIGGTDPQLTHMGNPWLFRCRPNDIYSARVIADYGVNIAWVGSPTTVQATVLKLAGPALYGTYAVSDFAADSSPAAEEFATKYEATYKSAPDYRGAWTYDAAHVLALAIENAKSIDPQQIREAILSVKSYQGAEGICNFDQNGDGLHGYNVVKNDNGKIVFIKHIDFSN